ncbi:hypothetical protein ACFCX4_02235 [Kitasatospora sp. NPDC056327]|uniref:hypothetical protein n=1 Tax=Kitasatospora sp. NPDC056327 TaxID=3345785 RepID=UPI0035E3006F
MSPSRTGAHPDDPASPAEPRRRFGFRRGPQRALPAGPPAAAAEPVRGPARPAGASALPVPAPRRTAPAPGASVLRAVGPHFVIAASTAREDDLASAIGALRPVPDAVVVVAAAPDSAKVLRDRMADLGVIARARGAAHLVLAASGLAALAPNGRRPAEVVAERAGVPVVAPDGLVEITPTGTLKVNDPEGAIEASAWWRCEPGQAPRRLHSTLGTAAPGEAPARPTAARPVQAPAAAAAPRPAPAPAPAPAARGRADAVRVLRLPGGFWLTDPADRSTAPLPDLAAAAAPPGNAVVLIGTPARPLLLPDDFAEAVLSLPLGADRPLVSAPWAAPEQLAALTGALAARTARPVQAAIGLPVLGPGGPTSRIMDRDGRAGWEPFLLRLATAPGAPTTPAAWRNGGADWQTDGPAVFRAFPYWALEAVPAGLWLRPEPPHVLTPRFRRPEAARPLLIVGERDRPVPADAFEELGTLLDRLPTVGAEGFGLLVHGLLEPDAERVGRFVARMHELEWLGAEQPLNGPPVVAPVSYGIGRPVAAARRPAPGAVGAGVVGAGSAAALGAGPGVGAAAQEAPAALGPGAGRVPSAPEPVARAESRAELPVGRRVPPPVGAGAANRTEGGAEQPRHQMPPVAEPETAPATASASAPAAASTSVPVSGEPEARGGLPPVRRMPPVAEPEPESGPGPAPAEPEARTGPPVVRRMPPVAEPEPGPAYGTDTAHGSGAAPDPAPGFTTGAPEPPAGPRADPEPDAEPAPVPLPTPVRATAAPVTGSAAGSSGPPRPGPLAGGAPDGDPAGAPAVPAAPGTAGPAVTGGGAPVPFRTPAVPPAGPPAAGPAPTGPASAEPLPAFEPVEPPVGTLPPEGTAAEEPTAGDPAAGHDPSGSGRPGPGTAAPAPDGEPARYFGLDDSPPPVTSTSTAERDAVRTLLGDHYHRCTGRLEQLATRLPGLRTTSQDDFKPDLAAVLLHHTDTGIPASRAVLVAAARSGDPAMQPFLRCLGSGLRRLPSHHGAVLLGAGAGLDPEAVLSHYPTGRQFREPAPLAGLTAPGSELPGSSVEFLVWSATGRRTSVFDSADGPAQAVFPPGTAFTVVGMVTADGDRPACVLLRESGGDPSERNRNALSRLRAWLERRAAMPQAERPRADVPARFHLTPGVELDEPEAEAEAAGLGPEESGESGGPGESEGPGSD